mmetsp:Transcript_10805/g.36677  ORF Transcript_10805/g.36677 Transcript_10805/m.36677 type:complete len:205 (+) Transcript_10805:238-852(+)
MRLCAPGRRGHGRLQREQPHPDAAVSLVDGHSHDRQQRRLHRDPDQDLHHAARRVKVPGHRTARARGRLPLQVYPPGLERLERSCVDGILQHAPRCRAGGEAPLLILRADQVCADGHHGPAPLEQPPGHPAQPLQVRVRRRPQPDLQGGAVLPRAQGDHHLLRICLHASAGRTSCGSRVAPVVPEVSSSRGIVAHECSDMHADA